jgi:hypothetical protein
VPEVTTPQHADVVHLAKFGANINFGHVHRVLEVGASQVVSQGRRAWCPGTLAKKQPLYKHTEPTDWSHGYGVEFANAGSGRFAHWNVPVFSDGTTGLAEAVGAFSRG